MAATSERKLAENRLKMLTFAEALGNVSEARRPMPAGPAAAGISGIPSPRTVFALPVAKSGRSRNAMPVRSGPTTKRGTTMTMA